MRGFAVSDDCGLKQNYSCCLNYTIHILLGSSPFFIFTLFHYRKYKYLRYEKVMNIEILWKLRLAIWISSLAEIFS